MKRGRSFLNEYIDRARMELDEQPVLTRCAFCPRYHQGSLAEGREWHRQHRAEHPQSRPGRKPLKRSFIAGSDIHDNIAATRVQGGHRFEETAA